MLYRNTVENRLAVEDYLVKQMNCPVDDELRLYYVNTIIVREPGVFCAVKKVPVLLVRGIVRTLVLYFDVLI